MLIQIIRVALCLFLLLPVSTAAGDVVILKTGETIEGQVLDVTRAEVTIKTKVHNIATTQKIRRSKIKDIDYKELPADFWDSGRKTDDQKTDESDPPGVGDDDDASDDDSRRNRGRRAPQDQYVIIPIKGGIGSEVTTDGLRRALGQSRGRGVGNIVFLVDSGGGYVYEAVNILEVLDEFDEDFEYHCVIEEGAISAASVFAAGSDRIYVRQNARLGGAVAYTEDNTSGAAEVDAKFNSIWSANLATRADAKGHQGDVFRAMVVLAAEVWQQADGTLATDQTDGASQIDGPDTILTMRASQMVLAGMATAFEGEVTELGALLGRDAWFEVVGIGTRAMTFAARDRADMERRHEEAIREMTKATGRFTEADPRRYNYRVLRSSNGTYRLDAHSMRDWTSRTDRAIREGNTILKCIKELISVNKRAERTGAMHLVIPENAGKDTFETVQDQVSWLKTHRNNPPARDMVDTTFGP